MTRKIDSLFSSRLAALAGDVNFACNTGQKQAALNAMVKLYNTVDKYESKWLLLLDPYPAQVI